MEPENVELNPITNLPVRKAPVNPITGKPLTQSQLSSPFTGDPMAYGFTRDMSEYTDYGVKVTPYQDIEEARAEAQPGYEQAYRGTLKALGTFGTALGMGIAGSVEGLKTLEDQFAVGGLDNVNLSRAFGEENETNKYLNQLNEELRESIPNYRTQEELQSIGTFGGMFNTNFIFDDFLNGLAFVAAAAATGWATGGAGVSGAIGSAAGSLGRFAMLSPRVAAGVNALKASRAAQASFSAANAAKMRAAAFATAVKSTPTLKTISSLPGVAAAGRVGSKLFSVNSIRGLETGFLMSTSEAAVEAFEVKNQYKEKLIQEALKKYNVESEYDLPIQVQQNINQLAENVGAVSFSANLPMLMATNMFAFRQLLRPVLAPRIAGLSMKAGKAVYAPGSKALRVGKVLGAESLSEAIQEGYQWGIQETLINQDLNKYNDFGSADMFYGLAKARENDFIDALKKTPELVGKLAEAPFNSEGRHAMILGGLIGGIVSGIRLSTGNQFEQEDKRGAAAEEFLNSEFFGNLQQRAARSNRVSTHLKNKEIFEKEGNTEAAERELAAIFQEEALFHVQNGSWDVFLERLALEAEKPLDEFKKDFDIQDDNYTAEDQKKTIKKLAEQLTDLAIYSDSLSFLFPTIERPRGLKRTLTSKKRMQEIDDQIKEQEIIRGAILRSHFTIGNLNEKITETVERMKQEIPEIANMIDDIVNTRRSLFGELFSKAERAQKDIKDEELYNSIKIKSDELVDKLNKAAEGIQDPVHQILFNRYAQKLVDLTQERDNYELAKNNLVRSPSKRDLFVSRTKLAEENKIFEAREKVLKEAIESAKTSKELADQKASLGKEIDNHPELKLQLSNAITAKLKEENDINERFNGLTLTEVKALTGLSPQEEYVRKLHLAKRAQESPITPKKEQAKKEPPKKPEEKKEKEEKPEGKKSSKEKLKSRRKKQGEQLRKKVGSLISLRNHNRTTINQQTFGEFEVEEDGGKSYVVVDSKGSPNEGNSRKLNGVPIINHGLMNSPNIKIGDTVELKVIEDDWWTSNPNVPRDHIQAPIYILVGGVPIGILQSGDHPVREAVWNAHIKKTGEVISTTITEKNRGYIFNAIQADGERYFYSLKTVENDLLASEYNVPNVLGVVRNNGDIELNIVLKEEDTYELEYKIATELKVGGLTPGQVFMVQVSPNGKVTILPLQTATLNQIARDQAAQLLDNLVEFEKVVGTTNLSTILDVADQGLGELSPLAVEPTSGDIIFKPVGDSVPAELMQAAEAMEGNLFIRIPASLLKQMWNREEVKFDQATFLDLLVYVETKEDTDVTTKQVFEQYHQKISGEEYSKLIGMLKPQIAYIFNDLLSVKRYNVNIAILSNPKAYTEEYTSSFTGNTYKNYYEYLTAEEENASERTGTAAILGASFTNVNKNLDGSGGSVFYDTEIKLNPEYSVNGVAVTAQVEDTPAETYEETEEAEEAEETQKEPIADSNQPETVDDFLNALLNPQETAAPTAAPVSEIKDLKVGTKLEGEDYTYTVIGFNEKGAPKVERIDKETGAKSTTIFSLDRLNEYFKEGRLKIVKEEGKPVSDIKAKKAEINRRRQEEIDNLFSKTQASVDKKLNTPVEKISKEEIAKRIEEAKEKNKDLIAELENPDFLNSKEREEEWDKKADDLSDKLPKGISWRITNGKIEFFDNQDYREEGFGTRNIVPVNVFSIHNKSEKFEVGDTIQVDDGIRALPATVTKVNENGKILEARQDDGRLVISKGNIITTVPINEKLKIDAKYDAELARELYKEMKAGKLVTDMTPAEQQVADKYITEELRKSVDAELAAQEGAAQPTTIVKEGVPELFESNPELANSVYEALGFNNLKSKVTLSKKFADTYNIVFNGEIIGTIDIPSDLEADTISIGDVNIKPEFRGKGLGVETYKAAMKIAGKPLESFMATDEANRVWNSLIKQGLAKKTDTGFVTISSQITEQQKQEAQRLYSQYLDTIFPGSKVKDIVYHWSVGSQISEQFGDDLGRVKGIWVSKDPNEWKDIIKNKSKRLGINEIKKHVLIINANSVWVDSTLSSPEGSNFPKGYDTIAAYEEADLSYSGDLKPEFKNIEGFEAVIKSKNQTYELGTEQDIEGFKKFVKQDITEAKQPTEQQEEAKPKKERRGPKSFNDFNVEEEEGRDIANRCNDDDSPF